MNIIIIIIYTNLCYFLVLINEENNALAEKAFEIAKEYVRRNPNLGLAVEPVIVVGNRSDAKAFLENGKMFIYLFNNSFHIH